MLARRRAAAYDERMGELHPTIKAISALEWDGAPRASEQPLRFDCHLEIGAPDAAAVDYFNLSVVNRAWARGHTDGAPDTALAWLPPRAMLLLETPSFAAVADCLAAEMSAGGPYPSWAAFAQAMWPYLRWDLEGVLYPPFQ